MVKQPPKQCHEFSATPEKKTVCDIKEKLFSIALAFDSEVQKAGLSTEIDNPDEFLMAKSSQSVQRDSEVQRCCGSTLRQN
jgi:hypothetical protein